MEISNNSIRRILKPLFILVSIASFLIALFALYMIAFAVGWGGGDIAVVELLWDGKGLVLLFIFSLFASIGLFRQNRNGIVFGLAVTFSVLVYIIYDVFSSIEYYSGIEEEMALSDLFINLMLVVTLILTLAGINRLRTEFRGFGNREYMVTGVSTLVLSISLIAMQ